MHNVQCPCKCIYMYMYMYIISGGFKGGKGGANEPHFGLNLVQRSTGDRLNGTPPSV